MDRLERELTATKYASVIKVGLATKRDWSDDPGLSNVWAMMIPRSERKDIAGVTIESTKDRARVPSGCEMLNLFVTAWLRAAAVQIASIRITNRIFQGHWRKPL
jgi:protoporphyrinogen/coproporphyrinogen III oxidase